MSATARPTASKLVATRAGAPVWRASASASFASGTAPRRITDEHVTGYGDGEFEGGVGEVAAGPRLTSRPTTLTSPITTKPAPASAAITTLPLRGIDLQGHPHTWPGHGNRGWHLRDCRAR